MITRKCNDPHYLFTYSKDELYRVRQRQSTVSEKKDGSVISSDSAIKMDTEPRHRQSQSLGRKLDSEPPKYQGATNYGYDEVAESK